jgi:hypothetical protein
MYINALIRCTCMYVCINNICKYICTYTYTCIYGTHVNDKLEFTWIDWQLRDFDRPLMAARMFTEWRERNLFLQIIICKKWWLCCQYCFLYKLSLWLKWGEWGSLILVVIRSNMCVKCMHYWLVCCLSTRTVFYWMV